MFARLVDALVRPGAFFAVADGPRLRTSAAVVVAAALPTGLTVAVLLAGFRRLVPARALVVAVVVTTGAVVVGALVGWVVVAALLYGLSWPLAEEGSFRELLALAGWGMLPHVLKGLVVLAAAAVTVSQLSAPADPETVPAFVRQFERGRLFAVAATAGTARATAGTARATAGTARATATGSLSGVQVAAGVGATLWSGYVWTAAVERARGLSRRRAAAVAAAPVVLMLLNSGI